MNLSQFLQQVNAATSGMTKQQEDTAIHEIARTLPENLRDRFLEVLNSSASNMKTDSSLPKSNRKLEEVVMQMKASLEPAKRGEDRLLSSYNEEYRYWNLKIPRYLFTDPGKILPKIRKAIKLMHRCIDRKAYRAGFELVQYLAELSIEVDGAHKEEVGKPLTILDLDFNNLLKIPYDDYAQDAIYLAYAAMNRQQDLLRCTIFTPDCSVPRSGWRISCSSAATTCPGSRNFCLCGSIFWGTGRAGI